MGEAAIKPIKLFVCCLNSNWPAPQVPWLNMSTGFVLSALPLLLWASVLDHTAARRSCPPFWSDGAESHWVGAHLSLCYELIPASMLSKEHSTLSFALGLISTACVSAEALLATQLLPAPLVRCAWATLSTVGDPAPSLGLGLGQPGCRAGKNVLLENSNQADLHPAEFPGQSWPQA